MIQNLKVDMIYYKTNTDFEMEFNLCGCCRMRLLNDKVTDRKTLLHSLARAVSRSRIIMVIGALFGESGITETAAAGLGYEVEIADNKSYGIAGEDEIKILKGSTPLVTDEGYFGGCIIECGPQTMILLTDNKNVRKAVMQTLIHPYIVEAATLTATAQTKNAQPETKEESAETSVESSATEELPSETAQSVEADISDTSASETVDNSEAEVIDSTVDQIIMESMNNTSDEERGNEIILTEEIDYNAEPLEPPVLPEDNYVTDSKPTEFNITSFGEIDVESDEFVSDDEFDPELAKADLNHALNLPILIIAIIILIALAIICYRLFYMPAKAGIDAASYIRDIFQTLFG